MRGNDSVAGQHKATLTRSDRDVFGGHVHRPTVDAALRAGYAEHGAGLSQSDPSSRRKMVGIDLDPSRQSQSNFGAELPNQHDIKSPLRRPVADHLPITADLEYIQTHALIESRAGIIQH